MADQSVCSIPNCGKPLRCMGWCAAHYARWYRHGDPLAGRTPLGEGERYYCEVVLPYEGGECLIWPYGRDSFGYAVLGTKTLHRRLCEEAHGEKPSPNHEVAHSCGNGHLGCVAKSHLRWATSAENNADKFAHGTTPRGERHGASKLTKLDVEKIRALRGRVRGVDLASKFGVSKKTISDIQLRKKWAWM